MSGQGYRIVRVDSDHLTALCAIAEDAYGAYIARFGKRPAPMDPDFAEHIRRGEVCVALAGEEVAGFFVTFARARDQFVKSLAYYQVLGFQEADRRLEAGFKRVYLEKRLQA